MSTRNREEAGTPPSSPRYYIRKRPGVPEAARLKWEIVDERGDSISAAYPSISEARYGALKRLITLDRQIEELREDILKLEQDKYALSALIVAEDPTDD